MIIRIIVPLVVLTIGIGLLSLIQKRLSPRAPIVAIASSIVVAIISLKVAASFVGINLVSCWLGLIVMAAFVGTTFVQSNPWEAKSILRSLAVTSGAVALYSAFASDLMITVFALLATGILVRLFTTPPHIEDRRTPEQSSSTGAA